jgi:hypothetical protein
MKAPGIVYDFQVGDTVEVYCDHEKNKDRVRGWIRGVVVQWTTKWLQFSSAECLPDRRLDGTRSHPVVSIELGDIREVAGKKVSRREKALPDY